MTISTHNRKRLQQAKKEARKRVIDRGIVEFRVDPELMDQLLHLSDYKKTPVGTLVRQWIAPIADVELAKIRKGSQTSDHNVLVSIEQRLRVLEKRMARKA